jgi:DNA-binding XRE family transcriptional regulator
MSGYSKWSDIRAEMVTEAGGEEGLAAARVEREAAEAGWKLAELRRRQGLTQPQLAERMGVTKARVSQIERGDVSTQDVVARYVEALGGRLQQTVHFPGGDVVVIARTVLAPSNHSALYGS